MCGRPFKRKNVEWSRQDSESESNVLTTGVLSRKAGPVSEEPMIEELHGQHNNLPVLRPLHIFTWI